MRHYLHSKLQQEHAPLHCSRHTRLYTAAGTRAFTLQQAHTPLHCSRHTRLYNAAGTHAFTLQQAHTPLHCSRHTRLYSAAGTHTPTLQQAHTPLHCSRQTRVGVPLYVAKALPRGVYKSPRYESQPAAITPRSPAVRPSKQYSSRVPANGYIYIYLSNRCVQELYANLHFLNISNNSLNKLAEYSQAPWHC